MPSTPPSPEADAQERLAPLRPEFPFASRFLPLTGERAGMALHYVDEGPGAGAASRPDAPTVLCVHGNPTWSFYWRALVKGLSPEARVVALDHLGMGMSSRAPGGVRLAEHIANLVRLIDTLDLSNVILVCHDWGGAIGFGAVLERSERFAGLVVTNTAAFPSGLMPKRIAACRIPGLGRLALQGGNAFVRAALRMTTVVPLSDVARQGLALPYDTWARREQVWRFVKDIPMDTEHPSWDTLCSIGDRLETLRDLPMEIVWGMHDWCFSPPYLARWRERFPGAAVTQLDGAGHYVMEDAPEAVLAATRRVLSHTSSARRRA